MACLWIYRGKHRHSRSRIGSLPRHRLTPSFRAFHPDPLTTCSTHAIDQKYGRGFRLGHTLVQFGRWSFRVILLPDSLRSAPEGLTALSPTEAYVKEQPTIDYGQYVEGDSLPSVPG